jgi:IPT/TIG domain
VSLGFSSLFFVSILCLAFGCGGGGPTQTAIPAPSPAPSADFSITLSANSLTLAQGATSAPINVSVTPQNGFAGSVQIALSGVPTGVISNPASSFTVAAGASAPILFGATSAAGTGNFTITAQGTSGSLSHSAILALSIQTSPIAALSRTTYARTDSLAVQDEPPGEAHRRHIAYDPANKHVFVANRAMNRVEVFSSTDRALVAEITIPGVSSADLSADGATVWVGTVSEQIVTIDTASLQVKERYAVPSLSPVPNESYDRPEEVVALGSGNCLVRLRESSGPSATLTLWNSASNTLNATPFSAQYGLGVLARSGDHTKILIATNDANNDLVLFDSNGNVLVGPVGVGNGSTPLAAANADGSRFAVVFVSNSASQLLLFDSSLNQVATTAMTARGLTFSRDANSLYLSPGASAFPAIEIFDGHSLQPIGQVPDASIQGVQSEIEDSDETSLLFGLSNRGVSFVDAANPRTLSVTAPSFAAAPAAQPSEGPAVGGTAVSLGGQNFESTAEVAFGPQLAGKASVASATQIQATSPPNITTATVNLAAYFPSGWLAVAPDAFSYGPQVLQVLPNAGKPSGGDTIDIYGYGFGANTGNITVSFGSATAAVQKVENGSSIAPSLGLDATYPFPLERITVQTPPGSPGEADVTVTSAAGTTTSSNAFQYLQSIQTYPHPGLYKFLVYDQSRQRVYLSYDAGIDFFDLNLSSFNPGNSGGLTLYCASRQLPGPCPDDDVRGMALTPDSSQLIAADFGSQSVYLLDPDAPASPATATSVASTGYNPARVASAKGQTVFISLSAEAIPSGTCASCLVQMDLATNPPTVQPPSQGAVANLVGAPLVQSDAAGDRVFLAYATSPGGPFAAWDATSNTFQVSSVSETLSDLTAATDGTMFATTSLGAVEIRNVLPNLQSTLVSTLAAPELLQIPGRTSIPGIALHPTGALLYQPFLIGTAPPESPNPSLMPNLVGGVDIFDALSGRLRLRVFLPEPVAAYSGDMDGLHAQFLTVDETGQRIFVITKSGLTVVQLASLPLALGTLSLASGPAAGGTPITIRGSGFQSGTTATIGGKQARVTFSSTDPNSLLLVTPAMSTGPQQLVLTNPNGETTTVDAAFAAN